MGLGETGGHLNNVETWNPVNGTCSRPQNVLPSGFIFQQDCAPAHTAKLAQDWIATNCSEFIGKDEWPPNSPDLNSLDYHVIKRENMLECCKSFTQAGEHRWAQESSAVDMGPGTSCHRTRSTKPYWASRKYFGLVWKLVVDRGHFVYIRWNELLVRFLYL